MEISSGEEEIKELQAQLKRRTYERKQRKLREKVNTEVPKAQNQESTSSVDKVSPKTEDEEPSHQQPQSSHSGKFPTYPKLAAATDHGKEYEKEMCAFYACNLITNDEVIDFEMTANNKNHGAFDDIGLKITFKGGKTGLFLLQLKHKENDAKTITNTHLHSDNGKGDFDARKYFKSMVKQKKEGTMPKDAICILYTNCQTNITDKMEIMKTTKVTECQQFEHKELLFNTEHSETPIFQLTSVDSNESFYFFTKQNNLNKTKSRIETMLNNLVQCTIYNVFDHFISEWWSQRFVLTKHDVIAKLTELALSPYIQCLTHDKHNVNSENLKQVIMQFPMTLVKNYNNNIVQHIWKNEEDTDCNELNKCRAKFVLTENEKSKILWYLDKVPLVIQVDDTTKATVQCVMKLLNKSVKNKKIVLVGNVERQIFKEWDIFENVQDLIKKCGNEKFCDNILNSFQVSFQGRKSISLQQLLNIDKNFANVINTEELLSICQHGCYAVSNKLQNLNQFHIPRYVSTNSYRLQDILEFHKRRSDSIIILNCNIEFKKEFLKRHNLNTIETCQYLRGENDDELESVILLSTDTKCSNIQFKQVCDKSKKANVHLFQTFNTNFCTLLLNKGNISWLEDRCSKKYIEESDIVSSFHSSLNVLCAPPGMGKSTLMQVLYNNCPPECWGVYINLINYNSLLETEPSIEKMWNNFLELNKHEDYSVIKQTINILKENKQIHVIFDGLDEIDSFYLKDIMNFIKCVSKEYTVWLSSRENLRRTIIETFNVVPIEIVPLDKEQQLKYLTEKLSSFYSDEKRKKIIEAVFNSVDLNNSKDLLGIPLQLHIITDVFLNDAETYQTLQEKNIFVLTHMYKLYFEGKIHSSCKKLNIDSKNMKQLGITVQHQLKKYEILGLKTCLDGTDFEKLQVDNSDTQTIVEEFRTDGDKYGIVKLINENFDAIFEHQTYAEYFACAWFKQNQKELKKLKDTIFSERYDNLRLMFDIMMAESRPLHLAIIYKNIKQFEEHIEDSNLKDEAGRLVLHIACTYGRKYDCNYVFDSYNYGYRYNEHSAVKPESECYITMMKTLVQKQSNINEKDNLYEFECVEYSIKAKCIYILELILQKNLSNFDGMKQIISEYYKNESVLAYFATVLGYPNLLSAIIKEFPSLMKLEENKPFLLPSAVVGVSDDMCVREGNIATVNVLLKNGVDINRNTGGRSRTVLEKAFRTKRYDMLKILINYGAKCRNNFPLCHWLVFSSQMRRPLISIVKNLKNISDNHNIEIITLDDNGLNPLQHACKNGKFEAAEALLTVFRTTVTNLDDKKNNALHYASRSKYKNVQVITLLIKHDFIVNDQNQNGSTALHLACYFGCIENVRELLNKGAALDLPDNDNNNALHYAAQHWYKNRHIIRWLLHCNVNVNAQNKNGTTLLHLSCKNGDFVVLQQLLDVGSSLNVVDYCNSNALHYASLYKRSNCDVIHFLRNKGFDSNTRNQNMITPCQIVYKKNVAENIEAMVGIQDEEKTKESHNVSLVVDTKPLEQLEHMCRELKWKITSMSEATNSKFKSKKREDQIDATRKGRQFKDFFVGNLALKLCNNNYYQDFKISLEFESYFIHADVVIQLVRVDDNHEKYFILIKNSQQGKRLTLNSLQADSGDFSLKKCFQTFTKAMTEYKDLKCIIYTNRKFSPRSNTFVSLSLISEKNFMLKIIPCKPKCIFNTNKLNEPCYKFEIVERPEELSNLAEYETFFNSFYIYANQSHVDQLKNDILKQMCELYNCENSIGYRYLQFMSEWYYNWSDNYASYKRTNLTKFLISRIIANCLTVPFIHLLSVHSLSRNQKLLQMAVSKFQVTIFDTTCIENVKQLWGNVKNQQRNVEDINKLIKTYQLSCKYVNDIHKLSDEDCTLLLWLADKCPLIVNEDRQVYEAIKLCRDKKFVIIGSNCNHEELANLRCFRKLSDLRAFADVWQNVIENFRCTVLGREVALQELLQQNNELADCITTTDLVKMADNAAYVLICCNNCI